MEKSLNKLRIVFIAGELGQGGAEKQLFHILRSLRAAGCEVLLLSLTKGEFWQAPIEKLGVSVVWIGQYHSPILRLFKAFHIISRFAPDIIQSGHFYTNLYTALVGRILNISHLGAIRSNVTAEIRNNGIFGRRCLLIPKYLVANSRAAISTAVQLGVDPQKIFYFQNVIDCDEFSPAQNTMISRRLRLLSIGSLKPEKNYGVLVDVCIELQKHLDIYAALVGEGPDRNYLQEKAQAAGMHEDVFCFAGKSENVLSYYQNTDVFLLPSLLEGTPNVVLEAMACGIPVIATRVGGISDLIEDSVTGCLVEPGVNAPEQFVQHLLRLAGDPHLRRQIGEMARQYVLDNHDSRTLEPHLKSLYAQVL